MRSGQISEQQFLANAENLCVECSVSALSSAIGQALIPIPILGAVIGNTAGMLMLQFVRSNLSGLESDLARRYLEELSALDAMLDAEYREHVRQLAIGIVRYSKLLESAFAPNCEEALLGSIALAEYIGVPSGDILRSIDDIDRYFME